MPVEVQPKVDSRVPLAKLQATRKWSLLSPKQALFCASYIESGLSTGTYDAKSAMRAAYNSSSDRNLTCLTYEVLENPRVKAVLNLHFGTSPLDSFLADLEKTIRKESGIAKVDAMKMYVELQSLKLSGDVSKWGSESKQPAESSTGKKIGDIVYQGTQKLRVTEVSASGKVLNAVEEI